jgi:threonine aldolase
MDGARLANALARTNASPAEATWRVGVDALSFGATKGGALAAEAVLFFDPARARNMPERRKRAGHLLSKHRFLAAQLEAYCEKDLWLKLARHANAMADRLAGGLKTLGMPATWPVEANEVFVRLPARMDAQLKAQGAIYYPWPDRSGGVDGCRDQNHADILLVRLVTSFATTVDEVDRFVATASEANSM